MSILGVPHKVGISLPWYISRLLNFKPSIHYLNNFLSSMRKKLVDFLDFMRVIYGHIVFSPGS